MRKSLIKTLIYLPLTVYFLISSQPVVAVSFCFNIFASEPFTRHVLPPPAWSQELILTDREKREIRSDKKNSYYLNAKLFIDQWGAAFADLVFGSLSTNKKNKVVLAMGGAEFLGLYLRAEAKKRDIKNIEFVELFLTTGIVSPWTAVPANPSPNPDIVKRGIGPVPRGWKTMTKQTRSARVRGKEALEYIKEQKLFQETGKVVVVDTGFYGSMAEVVNIAADRNKFAGDVSAVLLHHVGPQLVENTLPVLSLNSGVISEEDDKVYSSRWWAFYIDEGFPAENPDGRYSRSFQRSRISPGWLAKDQNDRWVPDHEFYKRHEQIRNFQSMLLGIYDAI